MNVEKQREHQREWILNIFSPDTGACLEKGAKGDFFGLSQAIMLHYFINLFKSFIECLHVPVSP